MDETRAKLEVESANLEKFKEHLNKSTQQTKQMVSILSHFDERLSKLEETIQPVYKETGILQEQQENILRALDHLDYVIKFYTAASEIEPVILGHIGDIEHYLNQLDRLQEAVKYFKFKNPESPELLNVSSLLDKGSEIIEKEFRSLLSRHSAPVPPVLILDLIHEDEASTPPTGTSVASSTTNHSATGSVGGSSSTESTASSMAVLEQLPVKAKAELRTMSKWLCDFKSEDFIAVYANIRSEILLKSLVGLRDHLRSASGTVSNPGNPIATSVTSSPHASRKTTHLNTPVSKKAPKSIQNAFRKFADAIPSEFLGGTANRSVSNYDLKDMDIVISEREIVAYLTSVTALYKLMQSELKLMEGIIPFQYQKPIFSRLVNAPINSIVHEGDELANRVKRAVSRNEFTPVLSLFPILRHQAAMRHCFDLILDGCSSDVANKFTALVTKFSTTISKALSEFVDFIKSDADTKVPKDGTVHELTSNVMIFLVNLNNYIDILSRVITVPTSASMNQYNTNSKDKNKFVYANYITRVLSTLGLTLKNKSDTYTDPHLRAIFMLNNFNYILKTLRKSELIKIVSSYDRDIELYYEEHVLQNKKDYSKSWSKILQIILEYDAKGNSLSNSASGSSMLGHSSGYSGYDFGHGPNVKMKDKDRQIIKDKFYWFNREFEEIRKTQTAYAIPDGELRESLKRENRDFILPRYIAFYNKYSVMNFAKHMDKYVKYTPVELGREMDTFFCF